MGVAGRGAIGNHRHRLAGGVAGRVENLHVEDGRKPAQPLRADTKRVHLVENLDAQRLDVGLRAARDELGHVNGRHQRLLGEQHAMLGGAANADAQHPRRAPAGAHLRQHFEHPVDDRIAGVHHLELGFVLAAAALGRDIDRYARAGHQLDMEHARRVVARVAPGEGGIGKHRGAQLVFRVEIGAAHAFVDHVLKRAVGRVEPAVHAPFHENVDDAGILADRPVPFRAHPAVGEDLGDGVARGRALLGVIGVAERADIIHRVEVADELQRIGHAFDEIGRPDRRRHAHSFIVCCGRHKSRGRARQAAANKARVKHLRLAHLQRSLM